MGQIWKICWLQQILGFKISETSGLFDCQKCCYEATDKKFELKKGTIIKAEILYSIRFSCGWKMGMGYFFQGVYSMPGPFFLRGKFNQGPFFQGGGGALWGGKSILELNDKLR